jgi:hypothetical protein
MSLYKLIPGSSPPVENNSAASNPQRAMSSNINGVASAGNTVRLDGAVDAYPFLPMDGAAYDPPQDAVETINVVTNSFNADQGSAGGGSINIIIKSGTNHLHGSTYEYNTISQYNARNYYQTPSVLPQIPKYIFNQYGVAVGGPILKNKLFFFSDWQSTRIRKAISGTTSVPTAAIRAGNFSGAIDSSGNFLPIYDPSTGDSTGHNKTAFTNNQVPVSTAATTLLAKVPLPNVGTGQLNNYFGSAVYGYNLDDVDAKINYNPSAATTVFGRYSISPSSISDPPQFESFQGATWDGGQPGTSSGLVQDIGLGVTHLVTEHLFFDANAGFTRQHLMSRSTDLALGNYGLNVLGIPGTNGGGNLGYLYGGIPYMNISSYAGLGNTNASNPFLFRDNQLTANLNITYIRGQHTFRAGGEWVHSGVNHYQLTTSPRGVFAFTGGVTTLYGASSTAFNSMADFLLGEAYSVGSGVMVENPFTARWSTYGLYAEDAWQVNRKITLNYGVRYELYPLPVGDHFGVVNYNPSVLQTVTDVTGTHSVGTVVVGGKGGSPNSAGVQNGHGMFVPRLGNL